MVILDTLVLILTSTKHWFLLLCTDYLKLGGLKQHTSIISQVSMHQSGHGWVWGLLKTSQGVGQTVFDSEAWSPLLSSSSGGRIHILAVIGLIFLLAVRRQMLSRSFSQFFSRWPSQNMGAYYFKACSRVSQGNPESLFKRLPDWVRLIQDHLFLLTQGQLIRDLNYICTIPLPLPYSTG